MNTKGKTGPQKFVQNTTRLSYAGSQAKPACKKKRIRRIADPHIEPYKVRGLPYYRYRRGTDPPKHLGTADFIRQAVTFYREAKK